LAGNLTAQALSTNKEWNIKVSLDDSGLVENVLGEFHTDFAKATPVTTDYIFRYEEVYKKAISNK
jgi:HKD family nuclease